MKTFIFFCFRMEEEQLLDYEEEQEEIQDKQPEVGGGDARKTKGTYASIHSSGFRDFLLKPEILRAIGDCGFEHPSEVQHECIPQAILGMDVVCQAKSGMGKTAVFVITTLQQLEPVDGEVNSNTSNFNKSLFSGICCLHVPHSRVGIPNFQGV